MKELNHEEGKWANCSSESSGQEKFGTVQQGHAGGIPIDGQGHAENGNDLGSGRGDVGEHQSPIDSVAPSAGLGSNGDRIACDGRINSGIDGQEIESNLLPMVIFYLAFHPKVAKRELAQHWMDQGWSSDQVHQWFHALHKGWRTRIISGYSAVGAISLFVRRLLGDMSGAPTFSIIGVVAMMMAIASAIYYYRPFDPIEKND